MSSTAVAAPVAIDVLAVRNRSTGTICPPPITGGPQRASDRAIAVPAGRLPGPVAVARTADWLARWEKLLPGKPPTPGQRDARPQKPAPIRR